jgi:hypothetical protein
MTSHSSAPLTPLWAEVAQVIADLESDAQLAATQTVDGAEVGVDAGSSDWAEEGREG